MPPHQFDISNGSLLFRHKLEHLTKMKMVAEGEAEAFSKQVAESL